MNASIYIPISKSLTTAVTHARERTSRTRAVTAKRRIRVQWAMLPLAMMLLGAGSQKNPYIHTQDSLSLREGIYSSLFFVAEPSRSPGANLPMQYAFTESGATPPGMKFEAYPCNKPDMKVCQQIATSNGVYLDGIPSEAGSYQFVIIATDVDGRKASQQFTVVVNPSEAAK